LISQVKRVGFAGCKPRAEENKVMKMQEELKIFGCPKTHERIIRFFERFPLDRLLDLGAGSGVLSRRLHSMGYQVDACDVSRELFKATEIPFTECNLNGRLPFPDATFKYALAAQVIEHLEDQFGFIRETGRILQKGGKLAISTPNVLSLTSRLRYFISGSYSLFERPINEFVKKPESDHISPASYLRLRYLLHTNGFKVVAMAGDKIRRSASFLLPIAPLMLLGTWLSYRKEKDPRQRAANNEIMRHVYSAGGMLSRSIVVIAEKIIN
jgi:SAM-dependent methyltransferase